MATLDYHVNSAPSTTTYYTVWNDYKSQGRSPIPSYAFLQARHNPQKGLYPMEWDHHKVRTLITNLRTGDAYQRMKATLDANKCRTLKQYGKEAFEHALADVTENRVCRRKSAPPQLQMAERQRRLRERPKTTGPTRHGSPIYNNRAQLLNKIRIQSRTVHNSKLANQTTLMQNIDTYNEKYALIAEGSSEDVSVHNARFVDKAELLEITADTEPAEESEPIEAEIGLDPTQAPVAENLSNDEVINTGTNVIAATGSAPAASVDGEELPLTEDQEEFEKVKSGAKVTTQAEPSTPPEKPDPLEKPAPAEKPASAEKTTPTAAKKNSPSKISGVGRPTATGKTAASKNMKTPSTESALNRPTSGRSSKSTKSGSTDSHVSMRPMIRTWVDDISVSSDGKNSPVGTERGDSAKSRTARGVAGEATAVLPEPPPKQVVIEPEEIVEDPQPPSYICPSSANKSREYAVKMWLANTDFSRAPTTVPLV